MVVYSGRQTSRPQCVRVYMRVCESEWIYIYIYIYIYIGRACVVLNSGRQTLTTITSITHRVKETAQL